MITLYKFFPAFGLVDPSPFCVKVEAFLRMTGAEYQTRNLSDPRKGPKGKLPFLTDGNKTIADSTFIIKYLLATYGSSIDAHLSPEQHALGLAVTRMLEEHLYWVIVHERWIDPSNWRIVREQFFGGLPPGIRTIVPMVAHATVRRTLHGQGLGRHTPEEIKMLGDDDIRAVSSLLGGKDYILGDRCSSYDASVYAFLSSILYCTLDSPTRQTILETDNLSRYCDRIRRTLYPEHSVSQG
jgi:glutathione S-transferase